MALLGEETSPGDIAGILTRVKGMLHGDRFSMEINTALKPEPLRPALSSLLNLGCCGDGCLTRGNTRAHSSISFPLDMQTMPLSAGYTFQERPSILLVFQNKKWCLLI